MERHNASTIRKASYGDSQERLQSNLAGNVRVSTNGSHYNITLDPECAVYSHKIIVTHTNSETAVFINISLFFFGNFNDFLVNTLNLLLRA